MPMQKKNNNNASTQGKKSATSNKNQKAQRNQVNKAGSKNSASSLQPATTTNNAVGQTPQASSTSKPQSIPAFLVGALFTALFIYISGIVLNAFQLLPNVIIQIAGGLSAVIAVIMLFWQIGGKDLLIQFWQTFWRRKVMWFSIGATILFIGSTLLINISNSMYVSSLAKVTPYGYLTETPTPTSPVLSLSLPIVKWTQLVYQAAPDCNNSNITWYEYLGKTFLSCTGHNLVMQYKSAENEPEVYLETVGGKIYDQTNFRVSTKVSFNDLSSTATEAQLVVQSPQPDNYSGGYIFVLRPTGEWYLCNGSCTNPNSMLSSGRTFADLTHPTEMTIEVYKGHLFALINQKEVVSVGERSLSGRYIGLRVGQNYFVGTSNTPSAVMFSSFELDTLT